MNYLKFKPNSYVQSTISSSIASSIDIDDTSVVSNVNNAGNQSRTELDSHTNMVVMGRNAAVIQETGTTAQVNAFSPECSALQEVRIVDAVVKWECPYTNNPYLLLFHNALHVPLMENNLLPPFIVREAAVEINDVPKIHVEDPTVRAQHLLPRTGHKNTP